MSKLQLPNVTLLMIETRCHQLAKMAIEDSIRGIDFGHVTVFSDQRDVFKGLSVPTTFVEVEDWPTKLDWCKYVWERVPLVVNTPYALFIQWDSWVLNSSSWTPDFLKYDYIGAPWWYNDGMNVGNSGFAIKSKKLMDHMAKNLDKYPVLNDQEDDLMCRKYRRELEGEGFTWAPDVLAHRFAFETKRTVEYPFGFHGAFNFPKVLDRKRLRERLELALKNQYLLDIGRIDPNLDLDKELGPAAA